MKQLTFMVIMLFGAPLIAVPRLAIVYGEGVPCRAQPRIDAVTNLDLRFGEIYSITGSHSLKRNEPAVWFFLSAGCWVQRSDLLLEDRIDRKLVPHLIECNIFSEWDDGFTPLMGDRHFVEWRHHLPFLPRLRLDGQYYDELQLVMVGDVVGDARQKTFVPKRAAAYTVNGKFIGFLNLREHASYFESYRLNAYRDSLGRFWSHTFEDRTQLSKLCESFDDEAVPMEERLKRENQVFYRWFSEEPLDISIPYKPHSREE
jgi:hypothetical protein